VCELGAIAARLGEVRGSRVEADVAILWDYQAGWAASGPAMPSGDLEYALVGQSIHRLLRGRGITADVVHPSADLTAYRVVVVPTLYLVRDEHAAAIAAAAESGAQVLVTFFSGISDEHDHVRLGGYPGAFRDLLGVRVEEFFPLLPGETVALSEGTGRLWSEDVTPTTAEVLGVYAEGPLAGRPAVTRARAGGGSAWYLSTLPDDQSLDAVLGRIVTAAGVSPAAEVAPGVEAVRRRGEHGSWLFLANDTAQEQTVEVAGHDLVSDRLVGSVVLEPGGVAVVREA
jgi:beta-galactosidase